MDILNKKLVKNLRIDNKVTLIIMLLFFFSCGGSHTKDEGYFIIYFPLEVPLNSFQRGKIELHSPRDTINLGDRDRRYTYLYLGVFDQNVEMSFKELKRRKLDTFVMLENNLIPFKMKFNELGKQKLDGYIFDQFILDNYDSNGNARIITNEIRIIKDVEVISIN